MIVDTSRFGKVEVDGDRVITFPKGLLGFPRFTRYVLLQPSEESFFLWLQSVEAPDLAFVVTDPSRFVPSYRVPYKPDQMGDLGIRTPSDAEVYVVVNKHGNVLTGNLQGPLIVHVARRLGEQLVLSDRRYTTRVPLVELPVRAEINAEVHVEEAVPA